MDNPSSISKIALSLLIHLPKQAPDPVASIVALSITEEPSTDYTSLVLNKPVTATCEQKSAQTMVDDDSGSRCRNTNTTGWFEIDLGKSQTFSTLRIAPAYSSVEHALLEVRQGKEWMPVIKDVHLKQDENIVTFPAATGDAIRFSFKDEPKAPQISDFELYPEL